MRRFLLFASAALGFHSSGLGQPLATAVPVDRMSVSAAERQVQEIVVTARRSGIPVWRAISSTTTVVLVGTIDGVTRDTPWNPAPLTEAILKADRVMFPDTIGLTASPFAFLGYLAKWRKQATLPKGQNLAAILSPDQFARLLALRNRGVLKPGFERKHPLHLAIALQQATRAKAPFGPTAGDYVRRTAKKNKVTMVPIARGKAKPFAQALFSSTPQTYVPCLLDSVKLAEAGPAALKARSHAWAERRVVEVLNSPAHAAHRSCSLGLPMSDIKPQAGPTIRRLLSERPVTLAVISLDSLARPGGILDELISAGFDVRGPAWRQ